MATVPTSRLFTKRVEEDRSDLVEVGRAVHDAVLAKVEPMVENALVKAIAADRLHVQERVGRLAAELVDKAIRSEVSKLTASHGSAMDGLMEPRFKSFESVLSMAAGREIRKSLDERDVAANEWRVGFQGDVNATVAKAADDLGARIKALEGEVARTKEELQGSEEEGRLAATDASSKVFSELTARIDGLESRVNDLRNTVQESIAGLTEAVRAIPAPQVYVPPEAIRIEVEQSTPQVDVKIDAPDFGKLVDAVRGTMEAMLAALPPGPDLGLLAAGLRDAIAALPAPVLPPPRLVEKEIGYDQMSRPVYTREREIVSGT